MFGFKKVKEEIHNWANDVSSSEKRQLEVIDEILKPMTEITSLWEEDFSYQNSQKELLSCMSQLYIYENVSVFLKYYDSKEYKSRIVELEEKGYSSDEAEKEIVLDFLNQLKIHIIDEKEFMAFMKIIRDISNKKYINQNIKKDIVIKNSTKIFYLCLMINTIRQRNHVYSLIIGDYEQVEKILGENGILLSRGEPFALDYVYSLEAIKDQLLDKKTVLELNAEMHRK